MVTKAETRLKTNIPKYEIASAVSRLMNEVAKDRLIKKKSKLDLKNKASLRNTSQPAKVIKNDKKIKKIGKKTQQRSGLIRKKLFTNHWELRCNNMLELMMCNKGPDLLSLKTFRKWYANGPQMIRDSSFSCICGSKMVKRMWHIQQ
ncbi:unnamed protein product [Onchocerca flexuosa]|uniref:Uncharacterized protein n=1 Tax=Onchocerca flexuosa TaxID=387005 RepID=A0A183H171_9BILA|nr:unnamed protein product [Onchocerca flexuosa]